MFVAASCDFSQQELKGAKGYPAVNEKYSQRVSCWHCCWQDAADVEGQELEISEPGESWSYLKHPACL